MRKSRAMNLRVFQWTPILYQNNLRRLVGHQVYYSRSYPWLWKLAGKDLVVGIKHKGGGPMEWTITAKGHAFLREQLTPELIPGATITFKQEPTP